jgi:phosphomevalonate kinase
MEPGEIDPVRYGAMWQRVQDMDKKIDKMERQIDQLLELANKSKGGLWAGMAIASAIGGAITWVAGHFKGS